MPPKKISISTNRISRLYRKNNRDQDTGKNKQFDSCGIKHIPQINSAMVQDHHFMDHGQFQMGVRIINGNAGSFLPK